MKRTALIVLCALLAGLTACGPDAPNAAETARTDATHTAETTETDAKETTDMRETETTPNEQAEDTVPASQPAENFEEVQTDFSLRLMQNVLKIGKSNVLISPYSVSAALAMAECGAANSTRACMETTIGMEAEAYGDALGAFARKSEGETLHTANSLWIKDAPDFSVHDSFVSRLRDCFGAESFTEPFDAATVQKLNGWVSDQTNGMIPAIIKQFAPDERMVLVNAATFEAKWARKYREEDIKERQLFTNADGSETETDLMKSTESLYLSGNGATGFMKPYENGDLFAAFLPDEGTPAEWLASLSPEALREMLTDPEETQVEAYLPPFTLDHDVEMRDTLIRMGMEEMFGDADFSGISDTPLAVSSVLHKTHIELDAEGTKAAAATAMTFRVTGAMPLYEMRTVRLDRPFAYMILDGETKLPIFIGTVDDLPES